VAAFSFVVARRRKRIFAAVGRTSRIIAKAALRCRSVAAYLWI
jgi:hypothetical protein